MRYNYKWLTKHILLVKNKITGHLMWPADMKPSVGLGIKKPVGWQPCSIGTIRFV